MNLIIFGLTWMLAHIPHIGIATTFDVPERDPWNKLGMACRRHQVARKFRALWDSGLVVASKHMACGTPLRVCLPRTGKCSGAVVGDYGPVHADMDLWAPLSALLHHNGMEIITWEIIQ